MANAQRLDYNHRRALSQNVVRATGVPRPVAVCAHHIVAVTDKGARFARILIFNWGIGINDADNGVFLPALQAGMPGHPSAVRHTSHHTPEYHAEVFFRLQQQNDAQTGRSELRRIREDLLTGAMTL